MRRLDEFLAEESGAALIYVTLLMPVIVGVGVLAVDFSRLSSLSTALQKGADSLALAAAAELDRKPTAIVRADAAIAGLVANQHKFSTAGLANVTVGSKRYLQSLPGNDATAIGAGNETTDPLLARYVEVTATAQTLNTILPASLLGGTNTATATARAVAGFDAAVCQFTPMFICNPYEGGATSLFDVVKTPAERRKQIKMQLGPGGESQYFPGNYGWLDSPSFGSGENGANVLRDALAKVAPNACFYQNGVSQKTGNIENADAAINTRFDLWSGPFNNSHDDSNYRPSLNVRKGYKMKATGNPSPCNTKDTEDPPIQNTNKLGRDASFPAAGGRLGDGVWPFQQYWDSNFGGVAPNGWDNSNLPSRFDVYRYEIDNDLTETAAIGGAAAGEVGTPQCYSGGGLNDTPDRRIIFAAVINCSGLNVHGNSGGPLPVLAFGKFFLTEPVTADGTIHAEITGLVEPGSSSDSVARDIVQLYR